MIVPTYHRFSSRKRGADSANSMPDEEFQVIERRLLTSAEEVSLARRIETGDRAARVELAEANFRLVVSIARRYAGPAATLDDLVQEGNIGLMRAVDRFDHRKGFRFSTYATWWIRQAITRSLVNYGQIVRTPVGAHEMLRRIQRVSHHYRGSTGKDPSAEMVAKEVGATPERVRELLDAARSVVSLDAPMGAGEGACLSELIATGDADPSRAADARLRTEGIALALRGLTDREREVVEMRYGLHPDEAPMTLEQVGRRLSLSRERVRQIEAVAMSKLRATESSERLRAYID